MISTLLEESDDFISDKSITLPHHYCRQAFLDESVNRLLVLDFEDAHEFARGEEFVGRDVPRSGFGPKRDGAFC